MRSRWALLVGIVALGALVSGVPAAASSGGSTAATSKIDPWLEQRLRSGDSDSFIVLFDRSSDLRLALESIPSETTDRGRAVFERLRSRSATSQAAARRWLDALRVPYRSLYIVNGLRVRGDLALVRALASRFDVVRIVGDPKVRGIETTPTTRAPDAACGQPYGISAIRADQVWTLDGAHGEGIVVASADTGVQWDHPAIRAGYRGWDGVSASHDYNWHDAIQDLAIPLDDQGHGTHTVGTMVGDDGAGNRIGVAPAARWIGCRNMDHGTGRPSTYLECNQFFLAPWSHGGDPETDGDPSRAPDVINNSWGCPPSEGCDPRVLEDSFVTLRAAGILAVAAAGNSGPFCATVTDPPAIYEEAFVAGATDSTNTLTLFSSRGPVTVDGSSRVRPDIAAPGSDVCSAYPTDSYANLSGTSMASPHTAGAAALFWSARPQLRNLLRITRCVMDRSSSRTVRLPFSQRCGGTSSQNRPNNMFGWGLVDVYAAVHFGPDGDSDGVADACDCAAADGGAYDPPAEVRGVGFESDKQTLLWSSLSREAGNGTVYDVVRGGLADLRAQGTIGGAGCLAGGVAGTSWPDPSEPIMGDGLYYVVRGRNPCGEGSWGAASSGAPRSHAGCP